jgi:hypothetical protein
MGTTVTDSPIRELRHVLNLLTQRPDTGFICRYTQLQRTRSRGLAASQTSGLKRKGVSVSGKSEPSAPRKVWRMSANAPLGEIVKIESAPAPETISEDADERPDEGDWRSSSYALLTGLEVRDYTDRIPPRVLDRLFKD